MLRICGQPGHGSIERVTLVTYSLSGTPEKKGIPFIDLTSHLLQEEEKLYYADDGHLNKFGNQKTAEILFSKLNLSTIK